MSHALAANLGACDFNAAAIADNALVTDALVLAAMAFPVTRWSEDTLAEKAVALGLERAIIDCLRLFDFAIRPLADFLR